MGRTDKVKEYFPLIIIFYGKHTSFINNINNFVLKCVKFLVRANALQQELVLNFYYFSMST